MKSISFSPRIKRIFLARTRMDIKTKIRCGLTISLLSISIAGISGYHATQHLIKTASWVSHTHKVETLVESILSQLKDAETGQRGYLLTDKPIYLEPYESGTSKVNNLLTRVKIMTIDNPKQQEFIGQIAILVDKKLKELKETIDLYNAGN